jgi:hypothetical protein
LPKQLKSRNFETLMPPTRLKLGADDPASLFPAEAPQYQSLSRAVGTAWAAARQAWFELREDWFEIANLADPAKRESAPLTASQKRALDTATSRFLQQMAGENRTLAGFVNQNDEDGVIQQSLYLANRVGHGRAVDETGHIPRNPALSEAQRERLARESFQRLSKDGRLRFEGRLEAIQSRLLEGFRTGENPLSIARALSRSLDLEASRTRTLVRTEMGIAAIGGQLDLYREAGISRVEIIGDTGTDALCTGHIGKIYLLGQVDSIPPYHPNCFCDTSPVSE